MKRRGSDRSRAVQGVLAVVCGGAYAPVTRQITLPTSSATSKEPAWTDALPEADRDFMQSIARRR
ncbi:hypothetical protein ACVIGB_007347 [Bradyrhizobium sp. USDA 4341]